MAEWSAPHGDELNRGWNQLKGEERSEGAGGSGNVEKIRPIQRGEVMEFFEGQNKGFVVDLKRRW